MMLLLSFSALALTACAVSPSSPAQSQPTELGQVDWLRDHDAALSRARTDDKPVFALFQEVPGCSTCKNFGSGPLSHPLLVEAIEELFVPLAIYNNVRGADARVLEAYDEPSWNNPVVRYLDADGGDIVTRKDRVWATSSVAARTAEALEASGGDVPAWLSLVVEETDDRRHKSATFAMGCFWQGEARLGSLDGVIATEAGWQGGLEVVEVRYDPRRISDDELRQAAEQAQCSKVDRDRMTGSPRAAADSDKKYFLQRTPFRYLPLTPMQRTKVNAALGTRSDAERWLSPRQKELLSDVRTALDKNAHELNGLTPPDSVQGLAAYENQLRKRLQS